MRIEEKGRIIERCPEREIDMGEGKHRVARRDNRRTSLRDGRN